ncbi:hypothetical protein MLD38_004826 [Melastoma candidum]|uniref:Uncharacterized protein n=1 Tax=Melastoma candidum TaxID=119954 RepID=A0ACB9S6N2_9MYRT|nr:hypothetical protein MLD38_004826 [Melastoma candidum]
MATAISRKMPSPPSFILLLFLFSLSLVPLDASHEIFRNLQGIPVALSSQPYRTGYHFQPPKNWMNDPNGQFTPPPHSVTKLLNLIILFEFDTCFKYKLAGGN